MEDRFRWTRGVAAWGVLVGICSVSYALANSDDYGAGGLYLSLVGVLLGGLGSYLGSIRTDSWYTWDPPVEPTWFEGVLRITGLILFPSPVVAMVIHSWLIHFGLW